MWHQFVTKSHYLKNLPRQKKLTNGPNLINQSEAPATEVILVDKLRTDLSVNLKITDRSVPRVTTEKRIPRNKRKKKSPAMSPPRKDTIPNYDKNTLGLQKDQFLPSHVPLFSSGFK